MLLSTCHSNFMHHEIHRQFQISMHKKEGMHDGGQQYKVGKKCICSVTNNGGFEWDCGEAKANSNL